MNFISLSSLQALESFSVFFDGECSVKRDINTSPKHVMVGSISGTKSKCISRPKKNSLLKTFQVNVVFLHLNAAQTQELNAVSEISKATEKRVKDHRRFLCLC